MSVKIEHIEWPDRPDVMMPYSPAIKVTGREPVVFVGVTLAPPSQPPPHSRGVRQHTLRIWPPKPESPWRISRNRWKPPVAPCNTSCTASAS